MPYHRSNVPRTKHYLDIKNGSGITISCDLDLIIEATSGGNAFVYSNNKGNRELGPLEAYKNRDISVYNFGDRGRGKRIHICLSMPDNMRYSRYNP